MNYMDNCGHIVGFTSSKTTLETWKQHWLPTSAPPNLMVAALSMPLSAPAMRGFQGKIHRKPANFDRFLPTHLGLSTIWFLFSPGSETWFSPHSCAAPFPETSVHLLIGLVFLPLKWGEFQMVSAVSRWSCSTKFHGGFSPMITHPLYIPDIWVP